MSERTKESKFLKSILILGIFWAFFILNLAFLMEPTPENLTFLFAIPCCFFYTIMFYLSRKYWVPKLMKKPIRNAILLSIFNAFIVETIFWFFEKLFGASGIAAHPNLLLDLIFTMPWYILLARSYMKVQNRQRFSKVKVFFLGGIYEIGGDGIAGPTLGLLFGDFSILSPFYWFMIFFLAFWQFILVYSPMVVPPALIINETPHEEIITVSAKKDALRPLI